MRRPVYKKATEQHHTVPLVKNLDWHLANLWSGGWMTVKDISYTEHKRRHAVKAKKLVK